MSNNYQHHVLEEGNILHPSNQELQFDSDDLAEAFEYYKATEEEEPLNTAIQVNWSRIGNLTKRLKEKDRLMNELLKAMIKARPNDLGIYKELLTEAINV